MLGKRKYSHFICPAPRSFLCACLALPRLALKMAVLLRQETKNKKISRGRARVRRRQILKTIVRNTLHVASHHLSRRCTSKPWVHVLDPVCFARAGHFRLSTWEAIEGERKTHSYTTPYFSSNLGENWIAARMRGKGYPHILTCVLAWVFDYPP